MCSLANTPSTRSRTNRVRTASSQRNIDGETAVSLSRVLHEANAKWFCCVVLHNTNHSNAGASPCGENTKKLKLQVSHPSPPYLLKTTESDMPCKILHCGVATDTRLVHHQVIHVVHEIDCEPQIQLLACFRACWCR